MEVEDFKERCLEVIDELKSEPVVITKKGIPIAKLIPIKREVFGCMKGTVEIVGDIIEPLNEEWDAAH